MGLIAVGLGPSDQSALRTLETEVVRALREGAALAMGGRVKPQSREWFGDDSTAWMQTLGTSLNRLASILNTKPIKVMGTNWQERDSGTSAAAQAPKEGWKTYTNMSRAQGQDFKMRVDIAWNTKPLYRPGTTPGLSKFHTIVHEMTHLVLNTDDVAPAYGVVNCRNKANNSPAAAKRNADNWAFFVDDMRLPVLAPEVPRVTSAEWEEKTKRGVLHTRSGSLIKLDKALAAYEGLASGANRDALVNAFNAWFQQNPKERTARNVDNIVDRMRRYVASLM